MSDDSAWIRSYKNRTIEYKRPEIPPNNILLDFHNKWFKNSFDEAATILANYYVIKSPKVIIGQLPENAFSSYDIERQIIIISDKLVHMHAMMVTFLESFFRHISSQNNWAYDKELSEYLQYEISEGGRFASRISHSLTELEYKKS